MALWGILGSSSPDPLISAHTLFLSNLLHDAIPRDMVEYKGRVNAYSQEVLRKESQIKELQGRIDTGDGCEYSRILKTHPPSHPSLSLSPILSSCHSFGLTSTAAFHAFGSVFAGSRILT